MKWPGCSATFDEQRAAQRMLSLIHDALQLKTKHSDKGKIVKLFYNTMRIAAGVIYCLAAVYFVRQEVRNDNTMCG